ncbi:hypothetical protein CcaCcLH18_08011 [Colletotrichum camelliae]|nr:hypothetical protein CcaCcLH18_08011 [Colletotrichum camelliae]
MLASIILEHRGVQLHSLAAVAPLRFVNNGPLSLLLATRSMLTRFDPWLGVALLLYCTTLALQFASTILLSDIKTGTLTAEVMLKATRTGMSFQNLNQTAARIENPRPYWMEQVNSFPTFAQYHEDYNSQDYSITESLSEAVVDTGLTYRVFLPFVGEDQRTSISSFAGMATVLDSRVVCARPRMHSNYKITLKGMSPSGLYNNLVDRWLLSGAISVDPSVSPPGLILAHDNVTLVEEAADFPWYISSDGEEWVRVRLDHQEYILFGNSSTEWNMAQWGIAGGPRLLSSLDPRYSDIVGSLHPDIFSVASNQTGGETAWYEPAYYLRDDKIPLMTGRAYQLMNVTPAESYPTVADQPFGTMEGALFHPDPTLPELRGRAKKLVISQENEWLVFTMPSVPGWRIATTLCFDSFVSVDVNVTLSTPTIVNEPRLTTWNPSTRRFGTKAVRQQLIEYQLPVDDIDHDVESHPLILETTPKQLREQISILYQDSKSRGLEHIAFPSQAFIQNALSDWNESGSVLCNDCNLNIRTGSDSANFLLGAGDLILPYFMQDFLLDY